MAAIYGSTLLMIALGLDAAEGLDAVKKKVRATLGRSSHCLAART